MDSAENERSQLLPDWYLQGGDASPSRFWRCYVSGLQCFSPGKRNCTLTDDDGIPDAEEFPASLTFKWKRPAPLTPRRSVGARTGAMADGESSHRVRHPTPLQPAPEPPPLGKMTAAIVIPADANFAGRTTLDAPESSQ